MMRCPCCHGSDFRADYMVRVPMRVNCFGEPLELADGWSAEDVIADGFSNDPDPVEVRCEGCGAVFHSFNELDDVDDGECDRRWAEYRERMYA